MERYINLPVHSLKSTSGPITTEDIDYNNPYDFTKIHRHDYFELIVIKDGGGKQWIDFRETEMKDESCYIILPGQAHQLIRNEYTTGTVVQFKDSELQSSCLLNCLLGLHNPALFEKDERKFSMAGSYIDLAKDMEAANGKTFKMGGGHLLHAFLFHLLGISGEEEACKESALIHRRFLSLVNQYVTERHTVQEYLCELNISASKLSNIAKKYFGTTPLQFIHNRILLEAKRLLAFDILTHKEIAYQLGFNNQPTFSQFVKNKTGYSPTELQVLLTKIHK